MADDNQFPGKNLLVLAPSFPSEDGSFFAGNFVKNQINALKTHFKKIIVIAPVFQSFGYHKKDAACNNYSYDNVDVYFPRSFYIPIFWWSRFLIDNRLHVVEKCIEANAIQFDLVHAHFTWPCGYIGIKLKEKYGIPTVLTIHEDEGWLFQEVSMHHPLIDSTWSKTDALIRVNKKDVAQLQRYNNRAYAIPNGFSPAFHPVDKIRARKELGLSEDQKIIFSLGHLNKRKGFHYLIEAMNRIDSSRNDISCYIGGIGPEKAALQKQIDMLNPGLKVRLLGAVPEDQLNFWMNSSDLFVLPSLSEGNPTVMFEALGCGKPFVGTRVGGVPEVITSDDYGLLVEPADSGDLMKKILLALDREWDREKILVYAGRFSWENIVKEIMGVYSKVL